MCPLTGVYWLTDQEQKKRGMYMSRELDRMRKQSSQKIGAAIGSVDQETRQLSRNLSLVAAEEQRVSEISRSAAVIIEDIDRDFKRATKLTDVDVAFLFLAAALQIVRQYVLKPLMDTERLSDKEAAKQSGKSPEHSDRKHRLYNPSIEEIISNPVPFDANRGAGGALSGGGKMGHRATAIGHDPILGLVFGTANIATSTLTNWKFQSWHISTQGKHDTFTQNAKTALVLHYTSDKLFHQGTNGKAIVGTSALKEIAHLRSDIFSKNSLPLPFISVIDPKLASELASWGLDMAGVIDAGKQFAMAMAIDTLIGFIHGLFYDESSGLTRSMYEVRTRRVLLYSNVIASASNVVVSAVASHLGGPEGAKQIIDWGGYLNTLRHIVFDTKFINEVKRDFLKNELYTMVTGSQYDFMEG